MQKEPTALSIVQVCTGRSQAHASKFVNKSTLDSQKQDEFGSPDQSNFQLVCPSRERQPLFDRPTTYNTIKDLLVPGDLVKDRWRVIKKLGGGGFGEIYEAIDTKFKQDADHHQQQQPLTNIKPSFMTLTVCQVCASKTSGNPVISSGSIQNSSELSKAGMVVSSANATDSGIVVQPFSSEGNMQMVRINSAGSTTTGSVSSHQTSYLAAGVHQNHPVISTRNCGMNGQRLHETIVPTSPTSSDTDEKRYTCVTCGQPLSTDGLSLSNRNYMENCISSDSGISATVMEAPEYRVAIKAESNHQPRQVLRMEVAVLRRLQGKPNVCQLYGCGKNTRFNYMVMTLQGKNLAEIRRTLPNLVFSLSSALRLTTQCLDALHTLHDAGFLHRDVKPSNFAIPRQRECRHLNELQVIILDFGLARPYVVAGPGSEVRNPRPVAGFRGTVRYASVHAHQHRDLARRDDLWSLFYMMVEFVGGQLPWRRLRDKELVGQMKQAMNHRELALRSGIPQSIADLWTTHLKSLEYKSTPDYSLLRENLTHWLLEQGIPLNSAYDWEKTNFKSNMPSDVPTGNSAAKGYGENCRRKVQGIPYPRTLRSPASKVCLETSKTVQRNPSLLKTLNPESTTNSICRASRVNRSYQSRNQPLSEASGQGKSEAAVGERTSLRTCNNPNENELVQNHRTTCYVEAFTEVSQPRNIGSLQYQASLEDINFNDSKQNLNEGHLKNSVTNWNSTVPGPVSGSNLVGDTDCFGDYDRERVDLDPKPHDKKESDPNLKDAAEHTNEVHSSSNSRETLSDRWKPVLSGWNERALDELNKETKLDTCNMTICNEMKANISVEKNDKMSSTTPTAISVSQLSYNPRAKIQKIIQNLITKHQEEVKRSESTTNMDDHVTQYRAYGCDVNRHVLLASSKQTRPLSSPGIGRLSMMPEANNTESLVHPTLSRPKIYEEPALFSVVEKRRPCGLSYRPTVNQHQFEDDNKISSINPFAVDRLEMKTRNAVEVKETANTLELDKPKPLPRKKRNIGSSDVQYGNMLEHSKCRAISSAVNQTTKMDYGVNPLISDSLKPLRNLDYRTKLTTSRRQALNNPVSKNIVQNIKSSTAVVKLNVKTHNAENKAPGVTRNSNIKTKTNNCNPSVRNSTQSPRNASLRYQSRNSVTCPSGKSVASEDSIAKRSQCGLNSRKAIITLSDLLKASDDDHTNNQQFSHQTSSITEGRMTTPKKDYNSKQYLHSETDIIHLQNSTKNRKHQSVDSRPPISVLRSSSVIGVGPNISGDVNNKAFEPSMSSARLATKAAATTVSEQPKGSQKPLDGGLPGDRTRNRFRSYSSSFGKTTPIFRVGNNSNNNNSSRICLKFLHSRPQSADRVTRSVQTVNDCPADMILPRSVRINNSNSLVSGFNYKPHHSSTNCLYTNSQRWTVQTPTHCSLTRRHGTQTLLRPSLTWHDE